MRKLTLILTLILILSSFVFGCNKQEINPTSEKVVNVVEESNSIILGEWLQYRVDNLDSNNVIRSYNTSEREVKFTDTSLISLSNNISISITYAAETSYLIYTDTNRKYYISELSASKLILTEEILKGEVSRDRIYFKK